MDIEPTENEIQVMMELRAEDMSLEKENEKDEAEISSNMLIYGFPF